MKRYLPGLAAIAVAICVSSYTVIPITTFYFVYGSGDQHDRNNYTQTATTQSTIAGPNNVLAWFSISDVNDDVTDTEFDAAFHGLDSDSDYSLNDESEKTVNVGGQSVQLQKKP